MLVNAGYNRQFHRTIHTSGECRKVRKEVVGEAGRKNARPP